MLFCSMTMTHIYSLLFVIHGSYHQNSAPGAPCVLSCGWQSTLAGIAGMFETLQGLGRISAWLGGVCVGTMP